MRTIWGISYIKRKFQERKAKYKDEQPADKAARRTADATVWIAGFTIVLALVSIVTLIEVIKGGDDTHALAVAAGIQADASVAQSKTTRKLAETSSQQVEATKKLANSALMAAGTQQRQLELTDRAWIRIEVSPYLDTATSPLMPRGLTFDGNGTGHLGLVFNLHNIGRSVATHARVRFELAVINPLDNRQGRVPIERQKQLCTSPPIAGLIESTVFPDYPTRRIAGAQFETKTIPDPPNMTILKSGKPIGLYLIGCVDYSYPSSVSPHQTGFVLEVNGDDNHLGIQTKMPSPVDTLVFESYWLGGEYAY